MVETMNPKPRRTFPNPAALVAFDTETHLVQPGLLAPPLVCGSFARDATDVGLLPKESVLAWFRSFCRGTEIMCGANIAYDFGVILAHDSSLVPLVFDLYRTNRIWDIQIAEKLHAIAEGTLGSHPLTKKDTRYSLKDCVSIVLDRDDAKKNDVWRLRYAELEHVPISEWPYEATQYPIDDALNTLEVAQAQRGRNYNLNDLPFQCFAAFCMHLGAIWGFKIDQTELAKLSEKTEQEFADGLQRYISNGFYREEKGEPVKNQNAIKKALCLAYDAKVLCSDCAGAGRKHPPIEYGKRGQPLKPKPSTTCKTCSGTGFDLDALPMVPRTEKDGVAAGRDSLYESGDETLIGYADWSSGEKLRTVYLPYLKSCGDAPLTLQPNVLVDTGRASYGGVIHQFPRKSGARECVVARPGYLISSVDFGGIELATHAQNCLEMVGFSKMAEMLQAGRAPHNDLAATIGGETIAEYEARFKAGSKKHKAWRQAAKPANFGFPGGMGTVKLVLAQRRQGPDTDAADGTKYRGLRFCILLGAEKCGVKKITEFKRKPCPPVCEACAKAADNIRNAWFETFPENREYFDKIAKYTNDLDGQGWYEHPEAQRIRYFGQDFCSAANGLFQGRAATGTKLALIRIVTECYLDKASPLYGSRVIMPVHDELITEHPERLAPEAADRVSVLMIAAMREITPDIPIEAPPALMARWYKDAEPVRNLDGRLKVWEKEV